MRTFVLSIGNTSFFGGVFRDSKLVKQFRVSRAEAATSRGFRDHVLTRIRTPVEAVAFCSVVPKETQRVAVILRKEFGVQPKELTIRSRHGLEVRYYVPNQLGTD